MTRYDVAVIGGGVMGCATAWRLARAGRSVVVFERFEIGHAHGSSHGSARIFRESYADRLYVEMMRDAARLWRAIEEDAGEQLLAVTGALNIGAFDPVGATMAATGSPFELLDAREVAARWPDVDAGPRTVYDPTAGVVYAERAWRAFASCARASGAEIREGVLATPEVGSDHVRVGDVEAAVAVITAGPWVRDLVPDLAVRPTRETLAYYDVGPVDGLPAIIGWDDPLVYGVPTPEGLFKAGRHIAGPPVHPGRAGEPDQGSLGLVDAWVAARLPGRTTARVRAETCMYTNTDDEGFILERRGRLVIGSACSGHGFKFAPLIGERLAALATR